MMKIKRNYLNCVKDNSSIVPWSWPPVNAKLVLLAAQHSLHFFSKKKMIVGHITHIMIGALVLNGYLVGLACPGSMENCGYPVKWERNRQCHLRSPYLSSQATDGSSHFPDLRAVVYPIIMCIIQCMTAADFHPPHKFLLTLTALMNLKHPLSSPQPWTQLL